MVKYHTSASRDWIHMTQKFPGFGLWCIMLPRPLSCCKLQSFSIPVNKPLFVLQCVTSLLNFVCFLWYQHAAWSWQTHDHFKSGGETGMLKWTVKYTVCGELIMEKQCTCLLMTCQHVSESCKLLYISVTFCTCPWFQNVSRLIGTNRSSGLFYLWLILSDAVFQVSLPNVYQSCTFWLFIFFFALAVHSMAAGQTSLICHCVLVVYLCCRRYCWIMVDIWRPWCIWTWYWSDVARVVMAACWCHSWRCNDASGYDESAIYTEALGGCLSCYFNFIVML